jgi:hypothetical protein
MNSSIDNIKQELGAVTFLDVLGWKGIWQQSDSAIETLYSLIKKTLAETYRISQEYSDIKEFRGKNEITKVLSISDTIALFTSGSVDTAIEIQAKICSWLLPYALERELPLRGAISYGEYSIKDNIMLGYAVDEAASWHESTDWIGVVLSPSAQMKIIGKNPEKITIYENIPFKRSEKNLKLCVDWDFGNADRLDAVITRKGPHTPEIAPKYLNTLTFLNRKNTSHI